MNPLLDISWKLVAVGACSFLVSGTRIKKNKSADGSISVSLSSLYTRDIQNRNRLICEEVAAVLEVDCFLGGGI